MLRNKGTSELQASYTPDWVNSNNILSGFMTESFSEFKNIKERGYGFKDVLSVLILMVSIGNFNNFLTAILMDILGLLHVPDFLFLK
jgi:hypothetical protein